MEHLHLDFCEYRYPVNSEVVRRITVSKDWDSPQFREFLNNIEVYLGRNQAFYDARNALVRFELNESLGIQNELVAKKFKLTRSYDRFRFHFLPSKAFRSFKIALILLKNGLKTPRPIAVIEERGKFNRLVNCYYLTEYLKYDFSFFQVIKELDGELRRKLIAATARNIRLMHDAGIIHNDLHASNILINNSKATPELYFIDLNRARQKKLLSEENRAKDLGRLTLNQLDEAIFFSNYDPSNKHLVMKIHKAQNRRENWLNVKRFLRRNKTQN